MTVLSARDLARVRADIARLPDTATVNATIVELRGPGTQDQTGEVADATTGASQWTGSIGGHLDRARDVNTPQRTTSSAGSMPTDVEVETLSVLRAKLPAAVTAVPGEPGIGWTVLYDDLRGPATVRRRALIVGLESTGQGALADKVTFTLDRDALG